jgi:hypothetical protein
MLERDLKVFGKCVFKVEKLFFYEYVESKSFPKNRNLRNISFFCNESLKPRKTDPFLFSIKANIVKQSLFPKI